MTVFVGHTAVESPLDYMTEEHRLKILNDKNVWKDVDRFITHWLDAFCKREGMYYSEYSLGASVCGILTRHISEYSKRPNLTNKLLGEVFRRAGVQKEVDRKKRMGGKRPNYKFYDAFEIVSICNWLRQAEEVGTWVGSLDAVKLHDMNCKPFISATYRRKTQDEDPPLKVNLPNLSKSLPNTFKTQPRSVDHPSSISSINLLGEDRQSIAKNIFHKSLYCIEDEIYWIDLHWMEGKLHFPQYLMLAHRLIDMARYNPDNHCLELPYNQNRDKYPEWSESLFNRLSDGLTIGYEDLCTLSITRFMCIVSQPFFSWNMDTRGSASPGRVLEDDDFVGHHKCRNPICIRPDHLTAMKQDHHIKLHRYCLDNDHPSVSYDDNPL